MKLSIAQIKENIVKGDYQAETTICGEILEWILNEEYFSYRIHDDLKEQLKAYWVTDKDLFVFTTDTFEFVLQWHSFCEDNKCSCHRGGVVLQNVQAISRLYNGMFDKYAEDWGSNLYAYKDDTTKVTL